MTKRMRLSIVCLATALLTAGCGTSTGDRPPADAPTAEGLGASPTAEAGGTPSGQEPSGPRPTAWKPAGSVQFQILTYKDKYTDDNERSIYLSFCPVGKGASWTPMKPGNISLVSTNGSPMTIVTISQ